jgi:hypothetical protein
MTLPTWVQNLNVRNLLLAEGGRFDPSRCPNVRIVHPKHIFPMPWQLATTLYEAERTSKDWLDFLSESYSLDFYQASILRVSVSAEIFI